MATSTQQASTPIDPLREKRLELGTKVFKALSPSNNTSARNLRQKPKIFEWQKTTTKIQHNLLLEPTLKRQRKKKRERERAKRKRDRRRLKWDSLSTLEVSIDVSEIFPERRRTRTKRPRALPKTTNEDKAHGIEDSNRTSSVNFRRLARRGGIEVLPGLNKSKDRSKRNEESSIPPPFVPKNEDRYIVPEPGQLISYLWHTSPSPIIGRRLYRTGVLCSNSGRIRFFEPKDEDGSSNGDEDEEREYYEDNFYMNKKVFKLGNFRVRTDLVEGAICYERVKKFACKILEIDEMSGAVLVEKLLVHDKRSKTQWISPDDLVGNYQFPRQKKNRKKASVKRCHFKVVDHRCNQHTTCSASSPVEIKASHPVTIDLTDENREDLNPVLPQNSLSTKTPIHSRVISATESIPTSVDSSSNRETLGVPVSVRAESSSSGIPQVVQWPPMVPDTDFRRQSVNEDAIERYLGQSNELGNHLHTRSVLDALSTGEVSSMERMLSDQFTQIRSQLESIEQHGMVIRILVSSDDLPTSAACLQFIKRIENRGIEVGSSSAEIVAEAEAKCRVQMQDRLYQQMTDPEYSGGMGYSTSHAALMLCRLAPILTAQLGSLDSSSTNLRTLLSLGMSGTEASEIFSYIQLLEEDILLKSISLKREFVLAHHFLV